MINTDPVFTPMLYHFIMQGDLDANGLKGSTVYSGNLDISQLTRVYLHAH